MLPDDLRKSLFGFNPTEAVEYLGGIERGRNPEIATILVERLAVRSTSRLTMVLLAALARVGSREDGRLIEKHVASLSADLRVVALDSLMTLDEGKGLSMLVASAVSDPSSEVRHASQDLLREMPHDRMVEVLSEMQVDGRKWISEAADRYRKGFLEIGQAPEFVGASIVERYEILRARRQTKAEETEAKLGKGKPQYWSGEVSIDLIFEGLDDGEDEMDIEFLPETADSDTGSRDDQK